MKSSTKNISLNSYDDIFSTVETREDEKRENIQRENILPSEWAKAYKMKLDAIRRQAGRPSKENPTSCRKFRKCSDCRKRSR